ncbi:hypothetical protein [Stenotrophomonas sp. PS02289]|uniref:type II toxin-antitoxin system HicB family antitoxin n=1 Tax=Stenotrophomonas sp. PS02289 TaxID=2991422 RepID=UPI00249BB842|nr:hypothetical protein [Stenotrophomonas sp. PS02289]
MRPNQILLRCFAERDGQLWVAYCLDLSLAAQGDTLEEVKGKLDEQIREYVSDALVGPDRAHAPYLLSRSAPASLWLHYLWVKLRIRTDRLFHSTKQAQEKVFKEVLPVQLASCR